MFKRLRYLLAGGFETCSIHAIDADTDKNEKILYVLKDSRGQLRLKSEEFRVEARESGTCAGPFIDYLQSEGAN